MNKSKLTIIMPVYNNMPYLKQAIKSVIKQNFKNWEMIISDDQSTDGSIEFLKKIMHKKIKIFFQKKNLGIFENLKFLNSKAKTSIIKILCADDMIISNKLENIYLFMKKNKSCKLMTCYDQNIKNRLLTDMKTLTESFSNIGNKYYIKFTPQSSMIAFFAFGNVCGNLSRVTYRKVKDGKNPAFDQKYPYAGDYNAWVRFSQKYGFYLVKKNYVYVRKHSNQASNFLNLKNELYPQFPKIYNFLLKNIKKKHHAYLRKYMLINNLPQRIRRYINCLISGEIKLANKVFANLPLKISILECFLNAFFFKFRNNLLNKLNKYYRNYIINIIIDQSKK